MTKKKITLAFTGASGLPYGLRLLECLIQAECEVHVVCSQSAHIVAKEEMGWTWPKTPLSLKQWFADTLHLDKLEQLNALTVYGERDWRAPMASGSNPDDAMVVCPCSMGTVAALASGLSDSLIERAADVILKERKTLVLVPRETPFSTLHLENLLKLSRMGVVILPPCPGFYHQPQHISDMVNFVVARILDQLGVENTLITRWGAMPTDK
ncbi:MAG: flavin prenyltransferase UbiX [Pseudomonadota bacterium]